MLRASSILISQTFQLASRKLRSGSPATSLSRAKSAPASRSPLCSRIIAVVTEGNADLANMVDHLIPIPKTIGMLTPILATIPLQLLAYHVAVMRGCNVDMPRNLAKSVTVE